MSCPSLHSLWDYVVDGRRESGDSVAIEQHLASGCQDCREDLQWLKDLFTLTSEDRQYRASEETIQYLVRCYQAERGANVAPSLPCLLARLIFDSMSPRQLADVRSQPVGGARCCRQMLFQAQGFHIDLRCEMAPENQVEDLIGQVMPDQPVPGNSLSFITKLFAGEKLIDSVMTDQRGLFKYERVPSGIYQLRIHSPQGEILIDQLETAGASRN